MKDDEIISMVSRHKTMYGINHQLLWDKYVYYLDRYKDDVDYKHNNQVLNINHLEKIRLLESKIEGVQQDRVAVQGPAESEEGGSWAFGVCQGGDDDDVQVLPEDRWGGSVLVVVLVNSKWVSDCMYVTDITRVYLSACPVHRSINRNIKH